MSPLDKLEIFYGECSPTSAQVYARVPGISHEDGWTISGAVRGPECEIARTLPATIRLNDAGPGEGLLIRAVVPDPCGWSPELPATYRVTVELHQHGDDVDSAQRTLGLRMLGPRGKSLYLEGRRFVLRGVSRDEVEPAELADWREAAAAMCVIEPDDVLCEAASSQGVLLAVRLMGDIDACVRELARLSRFPSVAIAIVEQDGADYKQLRRVAPNVLFAMRFPAEFEAALMGVPQGVQAVVGQVSDLAGFADRFSQVDCPVIACRPLDRSLSLPDARQACDHLQRDLAPYGDFAGYLV